MSSKEIGEEKHRKKEHLIKVRQVVTTTTTVLLCEDYHGGLTMLPRPESVMSNITVRGIPGSFLA